MRHIQRVATISKLFSDAECDQILEECGNIEISRADVLSDTENRRVLMARNCSAGWMDTTTENFKTYNKISVAVNDLNSREWGFSLNEIEKLQYLEYRFGQFYMRHVDNGDDVVATRKLTAVLQLTDPSKYIGGGLSVDAMAGGGKATKERGSLIVFPSHLPHMAWPVLLGKRQVLVGWFRGESTLT